MTPTTQRRLYFARLSLASTALTLACGSEDPSACPAAFDTQKRAQFVIGGRDVYVQGVLVEGVPLKEGKRRNLRVLEGARFDLESVTPTCGPEVSLSIRSSDSSVLEVLEVEEKDERGLSARLQAIAPGTVTVQAMGNDEIVGSFALDVMAGSLEVVGHVSYKDPEKGDWEGPIDAGLSVPLDTTSAFVTVDVRTNEGGAIDIPRNRFNGSGDHEYAAEWLLSDPNVAVFASLEDMFFDSISSRVTIKGSAAAIFPQSEGVARVDVTFAGIQDVATFELAVTEPLNLR